MIVYLPYYDDGGEYSNHYCEARENCYTTLDSAVKEIEEKGYKLQRHEVPRTFDMDMLNRNNTVLPMEFGKIFKNDMAFIKEKNLVEE